VHAGQGCLNGIEMQRPIELGLLPTIPEKEALVRSHAIVYSNDVQSYLIDIMVMMKSFGLSMSSTDCDAGT
jgi:hypothetical protein